MTFFLQLQHDSERMNQEVDALNSKKAALEDELSMSHVKKEAVGLYETLRDVEEKRDRLLQEERERGTPAQEREKLLQQVKDDNAEISTMERQIGELQDKVGIYDVDAPKYNSNCIVFFGYAVPNVYL